MPPALERTQVATQLVAFIEGLESSVSGWRAIHLQLSHLKPQNRRHFKLHMAVSAFGSLLERFKGELFQLTHGDIFYLWHGNSTAEVQQVVLGLCCLFSDDPLIKADGDHIDLPDDTGVETACPGSAIQPRFCRWFELEWEYDTLCLRVQQSVAEAGGASKGFSVEHRQPLDPAQLARIETRLAAMSLSGLIRRQPICAVLPGTAPRALFTEVHIAIRRLAEVLDVDLTADLWLFQRLGESLDRRLMSSLANGVQDLEGPISINLRLATLLSPEFLKFDDAYRKHRSGSVVIELQLIDIFAELGSFLFIREFLRDRGYLVCIDGLHYLHLPLIDRKRLGADMVKIIWSPDLLDAVNGAQLAEFQAATKRTGIDRVVLCRCDTADAVSWGHTVGIRLFQGYYVDSRLRAARPPALASARSALRNATRQNLER
jgi:EAL domain-containing protein (putative c-di-GMP-specific phosphodiesterase class I)